MKKRNERLKEGKEKTLPLKLIDARIKELSDCGARRSLGRSHLQDICRLTECQMIRRGQYRIAPLHSTPLTLGERRPA